MADFDIQMTLKADTKQAQQALATIRAGLKQLGVTSANQAIGQGADQAAANLGKVGKAGQAAAKGSKAAGDAAGRAAKSTKAAGDAAGRAAGSLERMGKGGSQAARGASSAGSASSKAARDIAQLDRGSAAAAIGMQRMDRTSGLAAAALSRLGPLIAVYFSARAAGQIIQVADAYDLLQARISLYADSATQAVSIERDLLGVAQRSRQSLEATGIIYTRLAANRQSLGRSHEELLQITETINKAVVISGANPHESRNALIQLSQGLALGQLRGEELRSVMEQLPYLADLFAKGLGVSRDKFRELSLDGKVQAKQLVDILLKSGDEVDQQFTKIPLTVGQSVELLKTNFSFLLDKINETTGATRILGNTITTVAHVAEDLGNRSVPLSQQSGNSIHRRIYNLQNSKERLREEAEEDLREIDQYYKNQLEKLGRGAADFKENEAKLNAVVEQMRDKAFDNYETAPDRLGGQLKQYAKDAADLSRNLESATVRAFNSMEDALVGFVTTGKFEFTRFVDGVIADLARIAIRKAITGPASDWVGDLISTGGSVLASFFGGGGGGSGVTTASGGVVQGAVPTYAPVGGGNLTLATGGTAYVRHTGGIVGEATGTRALDAIIDAAGLKRYHSGGVIGAGEELAVLQKGEGVFTPRQMANADQLLATAARAKAAPINLTVMVKTGDGPAREVQGEFNPDGQGGGTATVDLVEQLEGRLANRAARGQGPLAKLIKGRGR